MAKVGFWYQVAWVIRKDLRVEMRSGEALLITLPFGALAFMMVAVAVGADTPLLARIGPAMLWVVVLLFGMLITFRTTSLDSRPVRDLLALSGLDPAASMIGRSVASASLLLVVIILLTPLMIVFYAPPPIMGWAWLTLLAVGAALGLGLLGSLAGSIVSGVRTRTALAPLLVAPLAVPILIATSQGTDLAMAGRSIIPWLLLLVAMDLVLAIVGALVAGSIEEIS